MIIKQVCVVMKHFSYDKISKKHRISIKAWEPLPYQLSLDTLPSLPLSQAADCPGTGCMLW
jgi:hypothetical protein